jgi:hypothetical protein
MRHECGDPEACVARRAGAYGFLDLSLVDLNICYVTE